MIACALFASGATVAAAAPAGSVRQTGPGAAAPGPPPSCSADTTVFGIQPDLRTVTVTVLTDDGTETRRSDPISLGALPQDAVAIAAIDPRTLLVATRGGNLYQVVVNDSTDAADSLTQSVIAVGHHGDKLAYDGAGYLYETVAGHLYRYPLQEGTQGLDLGTREDVGRGFVLSTLTAIDPETLLGTTAAGEWLLYGIRQVEPGKPVWSRHSLGFARVGVVSLLPSVDGALFVRGSTGAISRLGQIDPASLVPDGAAAAASDGIGGTTSPAPVHPATDAAWTQVMLSAAPSSCLSGPIGAAEVDGAAYTTTQVEASVRAIGLTRSYNGFSDGWCTEGASFMFHAASGYWMNIRGDAWAWATSARAAGWTVTLTPQPRAVVVFQPFVSLGGGVISSKWGHVAWVDAVAERPDGVWFRILEMNGPAGRGQWDTRWVEYESALNATTDQPDMQFILAP